METAKASTPGSDVESDRSSQSVSRRALLKGATSVAVGATGLSAFSETAAAGGGCDYNPPRAPSWFGFVDVESGDTHNLPWGTNNITIFIHGFQTQRQGAVDYGNAVWQKLRDMGYTGDAFSFVWDSGSQFWDWWSAKNNANTAGRLLADWLVEHGFLASRDLRVHFVCHSLGARVALECLRKLHLTYNMSNKVNTVHFLGGAVWDRHVGGYYRENVEFSCWDLHNWHSTNDPVLRNIFRFAEGNDHWAVGWRGIASGPVPYNYTDHDHAFEIHQHCQYMDYNAGVIDDIYFTQDFW